MCLSADNHARMEAICLQWKHSHTTMWLTVRIQDIAMDHSDVQLSDTVQHIKYWKRDSQRVCPVCRWVTERNWQQQTTHVTQLNTVLLRLSFFNFDQFRFDFLANNSTLIQLRFSLAKQWRSTTCNMSTDGRA